MTGFLGGFQGMVNLNSRMSFMNYDETNFTIQEKKKQKQKIQATNFVIVKNALNFFFGSLNEQ